MKLKTRQITVTAILLAICIVSQFFKNLNVYITGSIINAALILTTVYAGLACGIILSVITPITSFFITGSPIMAAIPAMFPCIMIGNIILVLAVARIHCNWRCIKGSVYGNFDFSYHSAEYAPGKNAANVTCPAASIFCHTVNYRSDRRGICYHHSCGTA